MSPSDSGQSDTRSRALAFGLTLAGFALCYVAAARLGLKVATLHGNVSPVWPATGVAIGGLAVLGMRFWPAVLVGAFVANAFTNIPLVAAVIIAVGNTLEAVVGWWVLRRVRAAAAGSGFGPPLGLIASALCAPLCSATVGVLALWLGADLPLESAGRLWSTWWTGDAIGALVLVPVFAAIAEGAWRPSSWNDRSLLRLLLLGLAVVACCAWVFFHPIGSFGLFLVFPLLLLAWWWFGGFVTLATAVLVVAAGVFAAVEGQGPFAAETSNQRLIFLEVFCAAVAGVALALGAFGGASRQRLPALVMLAGWVGSGALFAALQRERVQFDQLRFDGLVADATQRIQLRMAIYENAMRLGASLLTSEEVDDARWRQFVEVLDFENRFPGFQGMGVIEPVRESEVTAFEQRMSERTGQPFKIRPLPNVPPELAPRVTDPLLVVTHFEPGTNRDVSVGLDLGSERNRRRAAEDATDTNAVCLSRRITLALGAEQQVGMLYLLPVFGPGPIPPNAAERRFAVRGWICAPIATRKLLDSVLDPHVGDLDLRLFESSDPRPEWLLFSSQPDRALDAWPVPDRHTRFRLGGQTVTAFWNRGASFVPSSAASSVAASVSLALGAVLLGGVIMVLQRSRHEAHELVAQRTAELKATATRVEQLVARADCLLWDATVTFNGRDWTWDFHVQPSGLYYRMCGRAKPELEYGLWYQLEIPEQDEMDTRSRAAFLAGASGYEQEFRVINGEITFWLREKVSIVRISATRFEAAAVVTDVTHRRVADEALRAANGSLTAQIGERQKAESEALKARTAAETANRAKSEFLATMSHEIRTPLNSIVGFTDLLLESKLSAEQRDWVSILRASGRSLLAIINDVLDISKIEAGKIDLERVPFDPAQIAQEVAQIVGGAAAEKNLELRLAVALEVPRSVIGDPVRFRQVVLNLVSNAVKFTTAGHVGIALAWERADAAAGTLRLAVTDTGIGIDAAQLPRLFQKFSQADGSTTRRFGGTGLGLAISKQLVDLMGGTIGVDSVVGQGSEFWFRLPLSLAPEPVLPVRAEGESGAVDVTRADPAGVTGVVRVLLAEDVEFNRRLAVVMLKKLGCQITHAHNGREAVELSARLEFDLVFMDCQMPELDGFGATQQIRAREAGQHGLRRLPIVAMTANAVTGDRERCLAAGMDDYLSKPISVEALAQALQRWAQRGAAVATEGPRHS